MSKIFENHHGGKVITKKNDYSIINCEACGYIHMSPLPDKNELENYYNEKFYEERPLILDKLEEDQEWLSLSYTNHYQLLEQYLPGEKKLFEIGCGIGTFLKVGVENNWNAEGIEASLSASRYAQEHNLNVEHGYFSEATKLPPESFQVVHMDNVLEHLADPMSILKKVYQLIEEGGLISIISPNDYNPIQKLLHTDLKYSDWWVVPPLHVNYFNFESMEKLLIRCGFEIIERTTTFPMEMFLLMGDNYIGDKTVGKKCHEKRKFFEMNLLNNGGSKILHDLYRGLAQSNIGRQVVILARKTKC